MASSEDALAVLRSIDATLKAMLALAQQRTARIVASQPKAIATDRELDSKYGNPEIKFNPRDWTGVSCTGARMSECPPDFLDLAAETFDYFAQQAEQKNEMTDKGKPVAEYKRRDAARARGWAKRIRAAPSAPVNGQAAAGWADGSEWS